MQYINQHVISCNIMKYVDLNIIQHRKREIASIFKISD